MSGPAKTAGVLFGLGVGVAVGSSLGGSAFWPGVVIAALGVVLYLVGTAGPDLAEDDWAEHDEETGAAGGGATAGAEVPAKRRPRSRQRPTLAGLGSRVEQILRLAEEQAEGHRAEARVEAEGIVTAARREAEVIVSRAHLQAAGISGDPPPNRFAGGDEIAVPEGGHGDEAEVLNTSSRRTRPYRRTGEPPPRPE